MPARFLFAALLLVLAVPAPLAAQVASGVLSRDIEAELIAAPRTIAPGAAVRLMYTVFNYEEGEQRVRLRFVLPTGWRLADTPDDAREWVIDGADTLDGEVFLIAPADAALGHRATVHLEVSVEGESARLEVPATISVVKGSGFRPGATVVSGTASLAALRADSPAGTARMAPIGALDISSRLESDTLLAVSYQHRLDHSFSNFRSERDRIRLSGSLRRTGWDLSFGNQVMSGGSAVTGPFVRGRGAALRRMSGAWTGEFVAVQPSSLASPAGGHLVRAAVARRGAIGGIGLLASDFRRPAGGYTTVDPLAHAALPDSHSRDELDVQHSATASGGRTTVRGAGAEVELRHGSVQRLTVRAGALHAATTADASTNATAEVAYWLTASRVSAHARWRSAPAAPRGVFLPGDELALEASTRLSGAFRVLASGFHATTAMLGQGITSEAVGTSAGVGYLAGTTRLELRGGYRESRAGNPSVRRTGSVLGGRTMGPWSLNGALEIGEEARVRGTGLVSHARADLRWSGTRGWLSLAATEQRAGSVHRRVDAVTSLQVQAMELAGGAWWMSQYAAFGGPGAWARVAVPTGTDLMVTVDIEYGATGSQHRELRSAVGVRRRFSLPLPFGTPR